MSILPATIEAELITGDELLHMAGVGPCELVEGRIKPMSPTGGEHSFVEGNVFYLLKSFVTPRKLGWVLPGEIGIYTKRGPDTVRGADVAFVSRKRLSHQPEKGFLEVAPELVIEVFSPFETRKELQKKIQEYFSIDVKWVWVVLPKNRSVRVYWSETNWRELSEGDTLVGEDVLKGFEMPVSQLFDE